MSDTPRVYSKLARTPDQWSKSAPELMAKQSEAALVYAFKDAKHDIAVLGRDLTAAHKRIAELEQVSAAGVKDAEIAVLREAISDAAYEWGQYVVEDTAPCTCQEYLEEAFDKAMKKGLQS
jgi:uncharacterized protein with PhoU and TrkA domain